MDVKLMEQLFSKNVILKKLLLILSIINNKLVNLIDVM